MAISKKQPMRPAEIELVDAITGIGDTVTDIENGLQQETKERIDAVNNLQQSINDEIKAREDANLTLQTAIESEETNRVNGDEELQKNIETTKTELQTMFEEFTNKLEWGSQDEIEVIANNNTVITVTFTEEKTEAPIVLITLQNNNGETAINAYAALKDVSTTEFHVRIYNLDETNNQQVKVNWLAIGE